MSGREYQVQLVGRGGLGRLHKGIVLGCDSPHDGLLRKAQHKPMLSGRSMRDKSALSTIGR